MELKELCKTLPASCKIEICRFLELGGEKLSDSSDKRFHLFDEHEVKMIVANDKNHLLVYID